MDDSPPKVSSTDQEVRRLEQVYRTYRESQHIRAQRDEENPANRVILQERQHAIWHFLDIQGFIPMTNVRVLDVGCGSGRVLASLLEWGAQPDMLYGVDLLPDRIAEARERFPNLHFRCANAEHLDFPDAFFDLVLLFTVFTSILNKQMACNVAREVTRVLNPHVRGMTKLCGTIDTITF